MTAWISRCLIVGLGLLWLGAPAIAKPAGKEFQVNKNTAGSQDSPVVAVLDSGDFVVVWQSDGQDGSGYGVYARLYDSGGKAQGKEFRVNTYKTNDQSQPAVAPLKTGGFVVTWVSEDQSGVFGQRYDATGNRIGAQFAVVGTIAGGQDQPSVAGLRQGAFVVVWTNTVDFNVYAQLYNGAGATVGGNILITPEASAAATLNPSVAALSNGDFVVTWRLQKGDRRSIQGQRFDKTGRVVDKRFVASFVDTSIQLGPPSVTGTTDGGLVVAFDSTGSGNLDVYAIRYDKKGNPVRNGLFVVNSTVGNSQQRPSVTGLPDGGFVVIWESNSGDGNGYGVFGQRYTDVTKPKQDEFHVNTTTVGNQQNVAVATLANGGYVVTWESCPTGSNTGQDGDSCGIYGQRFAP